MALHLQENCRVFFDLCSDSGIDTGYVKGWFRYREVHWDSTMYWIIMVLLSF